jgi:pimeloyl-ACP methyl ester carboxylesterase
MSTADQCPYVEKGLKSGPPLLFLSGFPDNETSGWGTAVPEALGKKYRCIFMCLPGYSKNQDPASNKPWGYEQEDVLRMMNNTINTLGLRTKPFRMVAHDWGAFFALLYTTRHPADVSKLILCDVGMVDPFALPVLTIPFIVFYQVYFAVIYIISQVISMKLATFLFWLLKSHFQWMMPTPHDRFHLPDSEITVHKCYPYYYLWRRLLTGSMLKVKFPSRPLLFLVRYVSCLSFSCILGDSSKRLVFFDHDSTAPRSAACSTISGSSTRSTPRPAAPVTPSPRGTGSWWTSPTSR